MDAKKPFKSRSLLNSAPPVQHKPRSVHDKLFEHSFYVGALALIGLMEWYAHLMNAPRMAWAYLALVMIAVAYAILRIPSFKTRIGLWKQARDSRRIAARAAGAPAKGVSIEAETASPANSKEADAAAAR